MNCKPKKSAGMLLQFTIAIILLIAGITKISSAAGINGFVESTSTLFADTFLAGVAPVFLYAVPFIEIILGVFLILGFLRCLWLTLTAVLFILFLIGQMVAGMGNTEGMLLYIFIIAYTMTLSNCGCGSCKKYGSNMCCGSSCDSEMMPVEMEKTQTEASAVTKAPAKKAPAKKAPAKKATTKKTTTRKTSTKKSTVKK